MSLVSLHILKLLVEVEEGGKGSAGGQLLLQRLGRVRVEEGGGGDSCVVPFCVS